MNAINKNCLTCGNCVHFTDGPAHSQYPKLCSDMGIRDYRPAPDCYSPAPIKIVRANVDVSEVGKMLRHLSPDQMVVLGQLLTQSSTLADYDLKFGQPVYVNLGSGEYLTNYFKGYVVGTTQLTDDDDTRHIYVSSDLTFEQADAPEFRTLLRLTLDSLTPTGAFKKVKEKLIAKGKLEAPPKDGHRIPLAQWIRSEEKPALPPSEVDAYEPPTIDTAPAAWLDPFSEEDVSHFKVEKKPKKKVKGKEALHDPAAEAKRLERARKRLNIETTTDAEGNVVKTISHKQLDADADEPEIDIDDLSVDFDDGTNVETHEPTLAEMKFTLPTPRRY